MKGCRLILLRLIILHTPSSIVERIKRICKRKAVGTSGSLPN
jgi:hypothetical protein